MTATKETQVGLEVMWTSATQTKETQVGVEVMWASATKAKVTQVGLEVMSVTPPTDFLVLSDGTTTLTVRVAIAGPSMATNEAVDRTRAFDGTMRAIFAATPTPRKRVWTVTTVPLAQADADALVALLTSGPRILANGQWLGAAILVWPQLLKRTPTAAAGAILAAVSFTLTEA